LLAVGGVAVAQTTGDERIYACVNNGDGTIRQVAGPDSTCSKGWHSLSWSAENPPATVIPTTTTYIKRADRTLNAQAINASVDAFCDSGDIATGGGFQSFSTVLEVRESQPALESGQGSDPQDGDNPVGWHVNVHKTDTVETPTFTAFAICQHTE
jgi:hypothetical protein